MADSFGQKGISKNYPVISNSGVDSDSYHEGREIFLEPEEGSNVRKKVKDTL